MSFYLFFLCGVLGGVLGGMGMGGGTALIPLLTLYLGVAFPVDRVIPRNTITTTLIFRTPLLRLAGACVLVIFTPGMWAVLPGIPLEEADAISGALLAGGRSLS